MIASGFDEDNGVMHPPEGVDPDECSALSVFRGVDQDGRPVTISCWKPTPAEWEEMRRTGRVWLIVWGGGMPPVAVSGHTPFLKTE